MDAHGLPIVGAAVDLTKVASIHQKRTLAFLNHFISHTINFLNKFSRVCETKLEELNIRIQRIETTLSILEAKLSSIPGLEVAASLNTSPASYEHQDQVEQTSDSPVTTSNNTSSELLNDVKTEEPKSIRTVSQDSRYIKYFKLLQMGVPLMAFTAKMISEGLNPDLLETPNAPAPAHVSDTQSASDSEPSD